MLRRSQLILYVGMAALVSVPVFKGLTGLPPYMGVLAGLGTLWLLTDALHYGEDSQYPTVSQVHLGGQRADLNFMLLILWFDGPTEAIPGPYFFPSNNSFPKNKFCTFLDIILIGLLAWDLQPAESLQRSLASLSLNKFLK